MTVALEYSLEKLLSFKTNQPPTSTLKAIVPALALNSNIESQYFRIYLIKEENTENQSILQFSFLQIYFIWLLFLVPLYTLNLFGLKKSTFRQILTVPWTYFISRSQYTHSNKVFKKTRR